MQITTLATLSTKLFVSQTIRAPTRAGNSVFVNLLATPCQTNPRIKPQTQGFIRACATRGTPVCPAHPATQDATTAASASIIPVSAPPGGEALAATSALTPAAATASARMTLGNASATLQDRTTLSNGKAKTAKGALKTATGAHATT